MAPPKKSDFDIWKEMIDRAINNSTWNAHDRTIQDAVAEINKHLAKTPGFKPLDWQLVKAMTWVETGAESAEWKKKPMQIGVLDDPGLKSLLSGKEGGELILPPAWARELGIASVRTNPAHNIKAGIGYLMLRMAFYEYKSQILTPLLPYEIIVKPGDSLATIAKREGSTVEILKDMNPGAEKMIFPNQKLKVRKGSLVKVISGWRSITTLAVAERYNGGGDSKYKEKLDYALAGVRKTRSGSQ
ncbi:MAG TPA: LysM domain-containing protein [Allosphingosinicella sp.]|jgi:hypothetical protein